MVLFDCFFQGGLRLPLSSFVSDVLKRFDVYLHQLTPNTFVRLSVFAWVVGSQGIKFDAESFCRVHELHYQSKADKETRLHSNFGCYSFKTQSSCKGPVIAYKTKWPSGWTQRWFYYRLDEKEKEYASSLVMKPLVVHSGDLRPARKD